MLSQQRQYQPFEGGSWKKREQRYWKPWPEGHRVPAGSPAGAEVSSYPNWLLASCLWLESFQRGPGLISLSSGGPCGADCVITLRALCVERGDFKAADF